MEIALFFSSSLFQSESPEMRWNSWFLINFSITFISRIHFCELYYVIYDIMNVLEIFLSAINAIKWIREFQFEEIFNCCSIDVGYQNTFYKWPAGINTIFGFVITIFAISHIDWSRGFFDYRRGFFKNTHRYLIFDERFIAIPYLRIDRKWIEISWTW